MLNELYTYACPKISDIQKSPFNLLTLILCVTLFSSLSIFFGNTVLGIIITVLYMGLSIFTFIDKDFISRYMKLVALCVLDISVVCIYMFSIVFPEHRLPFWSIIMGVIVSIIYEVVVVIKIKNRLYSSPPNNTRNILTISFSTLFLFTLIFRFFKKDPNHKSLVVIILVFLCSLVLLGVFVSVQKLVIYLIIKNKIQQDKTGKTGDG